MLLNEAEDINVSVPYYNCEFTMPWARWHNAHISEFLEEASARALTGQVDELRRPRYVDLLQLPSFGVHIPGQPALLPESLVSTELTPGVMVMLLTESEARSFFEDLPPRPQIPELSYSLAPSQSSRVSEVSMLLSILARTRATTVAPTPVERINARYERLLANPPVRTDDAADDEDEEYVGPQTLHEPDPPAPTANRTLDLLNAMLGFDRPSVPRPIEVSSGVKKVLNTETFKRVCPVISVEEITRLTTSQELSELEMIEENDTVGGPQDAGLGACSVCLALLVNRTKISTEIRKMPNCTHIFHSECLSEWLTHNSITCPVCREPAVTDAKDYGYLNYGLSGDVYTPAISVLTASSTAWAPADLSRAMIARRRA